MTAKTTDYKVKDISLADFGRKEIEIAEKRNAWPDGVAQKVRGVQAPERCPPRRMSPHDDSDRCFDGDPC